MYGWVLIRSMCDWVELKWGNLREGLNGMLRWWWCVRSLEMGVVWGLLEPRYSACKIVGVIRDTAVILSRDRVARDAPGALH